MKRCLAVVPAYNEGATIEALHEELRVAGGRCPGVRLDVLFIDDGSQDGSADILERIGAHALHHAHNLGLGASVQSGYKYAAERNYDFVIQVDGDGQHPPSEIPRLLEAAKDGDVDFIIGSRFLQDLGYRPGFLRKAGMIFSSWLLRLVTGRDVKDTTSGFRLAKGDLIRHFAKEYPQLEAGVAALFVAAKSGYEFKEVPVRMVHRASGTSTIHFWQAFIYPWKILIHAIAWHLRRPL